MTVCNMSIEAGARAGLIGPDDTTFDYIARGDRPFAPKGKAFDAAVADWKTLRTDDRSAFDRHVPIDASKLAPQVTWGTNPAMTIDVTGRIPEPDQVPFSSREDARRALEYMGLTPGTLDQRDRRGCGLHRLVYERADRGFAHRRGCLQGSEGRPRRPGPDRPRQRGGPRPGRSPRGSIASSPRRAPSGDSRVAACAWR